MARNRRQSICKRREVPVSLAGLRWIALSFVRRRALVWGGCWRRDCAVLAECLRECMSLAAAKCMKVVQTRCYCGTVSSNNNSDDAIHHQLPPSLVHLSSISQIKARVTAASHPRNRMQQSHHTTSRLVPSSARVTARRIRTTNHPPCLAHYSIRAHLEPHFFHQHRHLLPPQ